MKPKLIERISTTGSDGRECIVEVWQPYRFVQRSMVPGDVDRWEPQAFRELRTDDGRLVDCENEGEGIFRIRGSSDILRRSTQS